MDSFNIVLHQLISSIKAFLKDLHIDLHEHSDESLEEILTRPCPQREKLICILLKSVMECDIDISEGAQFDKQTISKVVGELSAIGIIEWEESPIVEGSAEALDQLLFWNQWLEYCLKMKYIDKNNIRRNTGKILQSIAISPNLRASLDDAADIIPNDLREMYKRWSHEENWEQSLIEKQGEIQILEERLKTANIDDSLPKSSLSSCSDLVEKIQRLTQNNDEFLKTYESHFEPRFKNGEIDYEVDRELDENISKCSQSSNTFSENLKLISDIDSNLSQTINAINTLSREKRDACSVLESISSSLNGLKEK